MYLTKLDYIVDRFYASLKSPRMQAQSWREILEMARSTISENLLGATPFIRLPHPSKPLTFAYVTCKILIKPKDCDEDGLEKLVVYFCNYDN